MMHVGDAVGNSPSLPPYVRPRPCVRSQYFNKESKMDNNEINVTNVATAVVCPQVSLPMQKEIHRVNLVSLLTAQLGKFVALDFIKSCGKSRSLNGRLGVRKHLAGGKNLVEAEDRPYLVVYDVKNAGYRTVNLATVSGVRAQSCV